MRLLMTAFIASWALALQAQSAEPIPLVVVPFDAKWGSRRLPVQPSALIPPPPIPGLSQATQAEAEPRPRRQRWCRGGC